MLKSKSEGRRPEMEIGKSRQGVGDREGGDRRQALAEGRNVRKTRKMKIDAEGVERTSTPKDWGGKRKDENTGEKKEGGRGEGGKSTRVK
jgi:hypothetical protein